MYILKLIFLFFFLSSSSHISSSAKSCSPAKCSRDETQIRFPFWIETRQPDSCGHPGFGLSCNETNQTIIELPSGKFSVQGINYGAQEIWINDPNNCLPKQILSLNLSGSPFLGVYYQDFTFFNCSSDVSVYRMNPIKCLSELNYTVFATSSKRMVNYLTSSSCVAAGSVSVPVEWPFYEQIWSSNLGDNLRLRWGEPKCKKCEKNGGRCGFKFNNSSSHELGCSYAHQRGNSISLSIIFKNYFRSDNVKKSNSFIRSYILNNIKSGRNNY